MALDFDTYVAEHLNDEIQNLLSTPDLPSTMNIEQIHEFICEELIKRYIVFTQLTSRYSAILTNPNINPAILAMMLQTITKLGKAESIPLLIHEAALFATEKTYESQL